ncbi:hypothetical protein KAI58_02745, partial [Candidatus Gracilibacteria bacterium]|nr:hypothetical protein [Candidatus Gracilibacteria bacterium]
MKKNFLKLSFIFIILFSFLLTGKVYSIDIWSAGYRIDTETKDVLVGEDEQCHKVTNTSSDSYFIPTKTAAEWNLFEDGSLSNIAFEDCGPIEITSCEALQRIGHSTVNGVTVTALPLDGDYILTQDIDCSATTGWNSGQGFDPIGDHTNKFTGTFDGKNYKISNLYINRNNKYYVGLFGYALGSGELKNVEFVNVDITA